MRRAAFLGAAARLLVVGLAALWIGLGASPISWALNAYWLCLLLATTLVGGVAVRRPGAGMHLAEGVVTLSAVQGLWPVLGGVAPLDLDPFAARDQGVSWRLTFTDERQALTKVFDLPPGWNTVRVFLRVDLANHYAGDAGFDVLVNGEVVGQLDRFTGP